MGVVVIPSARETFTPRELTDAYKIFTERGPQYLDAETGLGASAYRFGERVLLVYEESETGLVVLIQPSAWNMNSRKFGCRIVNILPSQTGAKRHSARLMHSTQHYILWCWMIMQLPA